jgi:hypothetical protein
MGVIKLKEEEDEIEKNSYSPPYSHSVDMIY